jgi:hypothetical protein
MALKALRLLFLFTLSAGLVALWCLTVLRMVLAWTGRP